MVYTMTTFKELVKRSKPLLGALVGIPSIFATQVAARSGFDFVMIDMEHSPLSVQQMTEMVHATLSASGGKCLPIVRIPGKSEEWFKWVMDSGARGIVVPMCVNAQQAKEAVSNAKYAIYGGRRSFGPFNAVHSSGDPSYTIDQYLEQSKDIAIIVQIESKEGVEHAEEILGVPGVTGCLMGPFDMRLTYGLPGGEGREKEYLDGLKRVVAAGKANDVHVGTLGLETQVQQYRIEEGFEFLLTCIDGFALGEGYKAAIARAQEAKKKAGV